MSRESTELRNTVRIKNCLGKWIPVTDEVGSRGEADCALSQNYLRHTTFYKSPEHAN